MKQRIAPKPAQSVLGVVLALVTFAGPLSAGVNQWTSIGPEGGEIRELVVDPATPSTLYAGTEGAGMFKSLDGGASWTSINNGLTRFNVRALAIDSSVPSTLYAGPVSGGVFKTTDGGATWVQVNAGLTSVLVDALAVDPSDSLVVYAGTNTAGLFKTTNGGTFWTSVNTGLADFNVNDVVIDPTSPSTVYVGTAGGGVFKSVDGATSWTPMNVGLSNTAVSSLAIDPTSPSTLFAAVSSGIFKTVDGGATWSAMSAGITGSLPRHVTVDPSAPATVYAGMAFGGVFKTVDGGLTWNEVDTGLTHLSVFRVTVDPSSSATVYAGTFAGGVFKSVDGGGSWNVATTGLVNTDVRVLFLDSGSALLAGVVGSAILEFTGSPSWTASSGLAGVDVLDVAGEPGNPSVLYAATTSGIFKSTDGGGSWAPANTGLGVVSIAAQSVAVHPLSPGTVYAGTPFDGVFKTTDGGASWSPANTGLPGGSPVEDLAIDPSTATTLYAGTGGGVFKSVDAGASWTPMNTGLSASSVRALVIDPSAPATLYAGLSAQGVFKTTDGAVTWSPASSGITDPFVRSLVVDPSAPSTLYAATSFGVFKSLDGGASWFGLEAGLSQTATFFALAIDPARPHVVYAGTLSHGVFELTQLVDLEVTLTESVDPVVAGSGVGNLTYETTVVNLAPIPVTGIELEEVLTLPAGVTVESVTPSAGTTFAGTTWTIGALAPFAGATLGVNLTVGAAAAPGDGVVAAAAAVTALVEPDSDPANDLASETTSIRRLVTVTKTAAGGVRVGDTVVYSIVLVNDTADIQPDNPGDELIDVLPPELDLVDARVVSGGGTVTPDLVSNTVTWNGSIPEGGIVTVPLVGRVEIEIEAVIRPEASGRTIVNEARIAIDPDGDGTNDVTDSANASIQVGADVPASGLAGLWFFIVAVAVLGAATLRRFGTA